MPKKVCIDCKHHVLSIDGECTNCKKHKWQDESITLICDQGGQHGCRGWAERCEYYSKIRT